MAQWMVEYSYDAQDARRDEHRAAHRAYLASLVDTGQMLAYGRFDDEQSPGALLLVEAPSSADVEALTAQDPFVQQSLVPDIRMRRWAGTWGAVPRS